MLLSPAAGAIDGGIVSDSLVNGEDEERAVIGHDGLVGDSVTRRQRVRSNLPLLAPMFNRQSDLLRCS